MEQSPNASNPAAQVRVCVLTPEDAGVVEGAVARAGGQALTHCDLPSLCRAIAEGTDTIVVGEEMFGPEGIAPLSEILRCRPEWSGLPVLLLATSGQGSSLALEAREHLDYVLLLSPPVGLRMLECTLRMALRSRRRQRQVFDLLKERQRLNSGLEKRIEALQKSEERFRRIYDADIIGIISADKDRIYEANDVFLQMVGFTRQDLEAGLLEWRRLTPSEYRQRDERALEELTGTGRWKPFEQEYYRQDGTRVPVLIGATLLERSPVCWICFVLDLSERKGLERQVLQAQKLESVGLLAGGIAHDFNNLLTGIIGNVSLALDEAEPGPASRLREAVASAERAAHLTRELLAYSGRGQFIVRDIDISQALNEMTDLIQFSIPKSADLVVNLQKRVPPVRMDPGQFQQILMNLVINAGEAIGEGNAGKVTVATSIREFLHGFVDDLGREIAPGRYVSIEVSDTGCGIPEGQKLKIFDPFFTTKFIGRGLGLAAVAGIIRSHSGAITVDAAAGQGSTFRVLLPVADSGAHETEPQAGTNGHTTILVVDDEPTVRDFVQAVLRRRGFRALAASDGKEALALLDREDGKIQAVVLDVVMPVMGAHELLPKLKAQLPALRVLLTSGYGEPEARRLCAAYPSTAFMQKPYTAQQIAQAVEDLLGIGTDVPQTGG